MAATATERKLLLDGEWIETGELVEVALAVLGRGRRARAAGRRRRGAPRDRRRRARACASRCPRTSAPRSSSAWRAASAGGTTRPRAVWAEAGKPLKAARVEVSARCRPTRWPPSRRASSPARWCRWTPRRRATASSPSRSGCRSASSARSRRSTSRSTSSRTRSRPRSRPAARSCSSPPRRRRSRRSSSPSSDEAGLPPGWLNVLVGPAPSSATCSSRTSA